jgi:hypothetical protein
MIRISENKKAQSGVVTMFLILVISVLLAGVVTMYGTNIVSARSQVEQLRLTEQAIWVYSNGTTIAAISIDNVGGRDAVISELKIRGTEASWSETYFLRLPSSVTSSLKCPSSTHKWSAFLYTAGEISGFSSDIYDKPLASGDTLVFYVMNPSGVTLNDVGSVMGITVLTENKQYYAECTVKSAEIALSVSTTATSDWDSGIHRIMVTITTCDGGAPSPVDSITVYYEKKNDEGWEDASSLGDYILQDMGDGTYVATFTIRPPRIFNRGMIVEVGKNGKYAQANVLCTDI